MSSDARKLDAIDRRILAALQGDASLSMTDLAARVGLSTTPCWRRVRALEEAGVIRGRVALLAPDRIGLGTTVFVAVRTAQHNAEWLDRFAAAVRTFPEVVEFYRMSGEIDYMLKVVVPDIPAFDRFYKRLIASVDMTDVSSSFAMEEIKNTTELPLDYL
ncbi:Lrp/AsnC family transcriptional regulator [Marivibrio halodurans]|uniref:Lrp/AsnC family transcriptional regulator n=1 Tax=Marivibrio halodurans TaxID=2039722 RepID=A0A8J7V0R8_9PROT|nr:Lrp/AsnC family transcriptional regulator [Marivibrio halodurans]MBP5857071.1 Lrp/AsnC family transcriptional regulator [Marivibrio halodurans]